MQRHQSFFPAVAFAFISEAHSYIYYTNHYDWARRDLVALMHYAHDMQYNRDVAAFSSTRVVLCK